MPSAISRCFMRYLLSSIGDCIVRYSVGQVSAVTEGDFAKQFRRVRGDCSSRRMWSRAVPGGWVWLGSGRRDRSPSTAAGAAVRTCFAGDVFPDSGVAGAHDDKSRCGSWIWGFVLGLRQWLRGFPHPWPLFRARARGNLSVLTRMRLVGCGCECWPERQWLRGWFESLTMSGSLCSRAGRSEDAAATISLRVRSLKAPDYGRGCRRRGVSVVLTLCGGGASIFV